MQTEQQKERLYDQLARRIGVTDWRAGTGVDARSLCAKHGLAWNGPAEVDEAPRRPAPGKAADGVHVRKGLAKGGGPKRVSLSRCVYRWPMPVWAQAGRVTYPNSLSTWFWRRTAASPRAA